MASAERQGGLRSQTLRNCDEADYPILRLVDLRDRRGRAHAPRGVSCAGVRPLRSRIPDARTRTWSVAGARLAVGPALVAAAARLVAFPPDLRSGFADEKIEVRPLIGLYPGVAIKLHPTAVGVRLVL